MLAHSFREFPRPKTLTLYLLLVMVRGHLQERLSLAVMLCRSFFSFGVLFTRTRRWWLVFLGVLFMCNMQLYRLDVEKAESCSFYT